MPMSHTQDLHDHQPAAPAPASERPASPWLWVALVATLFVAAWWWLQQNRGAEPAPAPVAERALPATLPEETAAPAARSGADRPQQQRTPALPANRPAQPLAGNALPDYPRAALRAGVEGGVIARIQVDARGQVGDVSIVQRTGTRDRNLDRAVVNAVKTWRFEPAMRDGRAVASVVQVPVDFRTAR
ncbi:TonB family protein [Flavobacterium sp. MXW15]|uniref:TonB family protein n=1 Tax=Xanthomonas chitinilytica TaxID=2989819 RepID=A0ABT3JY45_9XANT|nr:TonB family protein [Xanthomonas sp. H13-6]MCW4455501.1 TonB family protein [Flavobacterium sp. MXW15]MCW4473418.1 TonB family protein [Xanthomonas sp. H13-6]